MRLLLILFSIQLMVSCSAPVNNGTVADLDGYTTEVISGTNVTKASRTNEKGELVEQGYISGGKRNGMWITYYGGNDAGKIKTMASYSDGILSGPYLELSNRGQIETELYYENNKYNGRYATYKFGRMIKEVHYVDGQLEGKSVEYSTKGEIQKEINYKNGKQHGLMRYYNDEGAIVMEYEYDNGEKVRGGMVEKEE